MNRDSLVPPEWGRQTFEELQKRKVTGDFTLVKNALHELKKNEFLELEKWLNDVLSTTPQNQDLANKL